jgi:hypothetical protein
MFMRLIVISLISLLVSFNLKAFEVLIRIKPRVPLVNTNEDRRGRVQQDEVICVCPDGWQWGTAELNKTNYIIIKFPQVSLEQGKKLELVQYIQNGTNELGEPRLDIYRKRIYKIRRADLPVAARNKLIATGQLIIKASAAYTGSYDYTWAQVRQYFRNQETGLDESGEL